jgi:FKBP-type peptidyl-prolyl cis-trans isomerase FkpA
MKLTILKPLLFLIGIVLVLISCKKDNTETTPVFDSARQARIDDSLLVDYLSRNGLTDSFTKTSSGLYYRITKRYPDSVLVAPDSMVFNSDTALITNRIKVFFRYEGRLLNDTLFDENLKAAKALDFFPGNNSLIKGFEEGVLKFRNREEGYLLIPSRLAYGNSVQGKIPRNSCVRFFVRITNVER